MVEPWRRTTLMKPQLTVDYHGLTATDALIRFSADYLRIERSGSKRRTLQVVHGYGSGGDGGIIRTLLRRVLDFQTVSGTLTWTESEQVDTHAGYTLVTAKCPLAPLARGVLSPPLSEQTEHQLLQAFNLRLRAPETTSSAAAGLVALGESAREALDRLTLEAAEPAQCEEPARPLTFADLYKPNPSSKQRRK